MTKKFKFKPATWNPLGLYRSIKWYREKLPSNISTWWIIKRHFWGT